MVLQVQKNQPIEALRQALSQPFPADKVDEIFQYYDSSVHKYRLDKYAECMVDAGKFAEAVLKCFHYLRTQEVVDAVKVEQEVIQLEKSTDLDNSVRMAIPRTLRLIYGYRNQRGAAHNNSFDPNRMDAAHVVASLKWVLGELARLYLNAHPDEAQKLVTNLLARDLPLIEEIDGTYVILLPDLPARIQLEVLLYRHHPHRCQFKDLAVWIGAAHSEANIRVTLSNLKKKALVHENQDGWRLTESGFREAAWEITQIQLSDGSSNNRQVKKKKGTRRGGKR